MQTNGTDGKHILRRFAFWGSQPTILSIYQIKNHKWGTQPHENFLLQKSDVEKFAEFNSEIIFLIRTKWGRYRQNSAFRIPVSN